MCKLKISSFVNLFRKRSSRRERELVGEPSQDQTEESTIFNATELGYNTSLSPFFCVQLCAKW